MSNETGRANGGLRLVYVVARPFAGGAARRVLVRIVIRTLIAYRIKNAPLAAPLLRAPLKKAQRDAIKEGVPA